jgi:hypothetical protein
MITKLDTEDLGVSIRGKKYVVSFLSLIMRLIVIGQNQNSHGILLGIRQNQDVLIVVQEKLVIWLQGNVIQDFPEFFIKFVVNQTEQLV